MKAALVIAKKEFRAGLNSPVAYGLVGAFLVFTAAWLYFVQGFYARGLADLGPYFSLMPLVLAFLAPAITMRSWAEEKRQGTYELLLTMPMKEYELVAGKFLASFALVALAVLLGLPVALMAGLLGSFDPGILFGQYLGVLLVAAASVSIGQWVSSRAKNQVSAFLGGTLLILALALADRVGAYLGTKGILADLFNSLSLGWHFEAFSRGVLDSRDLAYYLGMSFLFLYLTAHRVESRKWGKA